MLLARFSRTGVGMKTPFNNLKAFFGTASLRGKIDEANQEVLKRIYAADVWLTGVKPAKEVIPWLGAGKKRVLVSGPPVTWKQMCGAQKGAVQGIVLFEGWAQTPEEAYKMVDKGEVEIDCNHHHNSCGPMAGTISPNFPVYVVENRAFKNIVFSRPADLSQQFGDYKDINDIKWWRDGVAPYLDQGIQKLGGLNLTQIVQLALEMGDEAHNRNNAFTSLFVNYAAMGMIDAGVPKDKMLPLLKWYSPDTWNTGSGVRACLGLVMTLGKAMMDPTMNVEHSTIVSCMARNGFEFGIRLSGTGKDWFTAPSPIPEGKYFPPYTKADSGGDMGDSAITETAGFGTFVLAGSPSFLKALPLNVAQALDLTLQNKSVAIGANPKIQFPAFDYEGIPTGIDMRLIFTKKQLPWINTGITHKDAGHRVIGRGIVQAPQQCFDKALNAYCTKYKISREELLSTVA